MGSNAKSRSASKVALESFDDLFGGSAAQECGIEQIINAPLAELYTFKDHPSRVEDDEKIFVTAIPVSSTPLLRSYLPDKHGLCC